MPTRLALLPTLSLSAVWAAAVCAQAPLPDTTNGPRPLLLGGYYGTDVNGEVRAEGVTFRGAFPTEAGGIGLYTRTGDTAYYDQSGALTDEASAPLAPIDAPITAFDNAYRLEGTQLYFRGADGEERLISEGLFAVSQQQYRLLGVTPYGTALVGSRYSPYRPGPLPGEALLVVDSTGRLVTTVGSTHWMDPIQFAYVPGGIFVHGTNSSCGGGVNAQYALAARLPYEALVRPVIPALEEADGRLCAPSDSLAGAFPTSAGGAAVVARLERFGTRPPTRYTVDYFGLRYVYPFEGALALAEVVDSVDVRRACLPGQKSAVVLLGVDAATVASVTIGGVDVGEADGYRASFPPGVRSVSIVVTDTAGCRAEAQAATFPELIDVRVRNACADGSVLGGLSQQGYITGELRYRFAAPGIDSLSPRLQPGTYAVTLATASGCALDTVVTVAAAPPIETVLDTVPLPGGDGYEVAVRQASPRGADYVYEVVNFGYDTAWVLPAPGTYTLAVTQYSTGAVCRSRTGFSLPAIVSALGELPAPDFRARLTADGTLHCEGLPVGAAGVEVLDITGRRLLARALAPGQVQVTIQLALPAGTYLAVVRDRGGRAAVRKLARQ